MEVRGREKLPKPPYLVASKHQSAWDTFALIPIFSDPAMVMKAELRHIPFHGWFSRKFEHVFVRRDRGPSALRQLLRDANARTAAGREVVIFPEGTRRTPGAAPDYKPGVVRAVRGAWAAVRAGRAQLRPLSGRGAASCAIPAPSSSRSSTRFRRACRGLSSAACSRHASKPLRTGLSGKRPSRPSLRRFPRRPFNEFRPRQTRQRANRFRQSVVLIMLFMIIKTYPRAIKSAPWIFVLRTPLPTCVPATLPCPPAEDPRSPQGLVAYDGR